MEIKSYKYLKNNKYKILLDNDEIILYEDIILKYSILLKKEISKEELNKYMNENQVFENYYKALKYIQIRIRSKKEVKDYLKKNGANEKESNDILEKLEKQGYINDRLFCRSYINDSIYLKNHGPLKIIDNLKKLGITDEIINEEIKIFSKELQKEKIKKYIDKQVKLNKNKSLMILKNKMLNNLILMGYHKEDIINFLDQIKIDEEDLFKKEYNKLYNKLSKKYNGYELEMKIKQKLYQKGFYK